MFIHLRCASFALALVAGSGMAIAQTPPATPGGVDDSITHPAPPARSLSQLQLTPAQRTTILNAVRQGGAKVASPVNFVASVGALVPPSIELYLLPDGVLAQVPEARVVKYTTVQNQIVLVDPTTMRVVDVISQ
jgi:Protein of unknown function (DUF1236)